MNQFKEMLWQVIEDMGPLALTGVPDGSNAKAGEVGEFVRGQAAVNFAAHVVTTSTVSPLVVPPGDWDLFGIVTVSTPIGLLYVATNPPPAGLSDWMTAQEGVLGVPQTAPFSGGATTGDLTLNTVRGSFTVPTVLSFSVTVNQTADPALVAGTINVIVSGRRRR